MRVLHAYKIYKPDIEGGIPAVISTLTELARPNIDNEVLTARRFGWFRRQRTGRTPVIAVSSVGNLISTPVAPTYVWWLRARANHAAIVVHHAPFPLTDLAIALSFPRRTGLIIYWHGDIAGRSLLKRLLAPIFRFALARADAVIVSSDVIVANSPFLRPVAEKCVAIPYGIDTAYWRQLDHLQQKAAGDLRKAHPRLVVALGRLVGYKGYDVLLRALRQVDADLIIVGDGPLRTRLEALAKTLRVSARVTFAGLLTSDQIKTLLHAANVFVMPSNTIAEAFGLAQVEAMAAGCPVVNTSLRTTVPRVARHKLEGLTVPPDDPDALATAICEMLDDPKHAAQLGAAGQARAAAEFDQAVFVNRIENLYQSVMQKRCNAS